MARAKLAGLRTHGTITLDGPFFRHDPGRTFGQNVRALMAAVAAEGEKDAQARIASIPPAGIRTGRTRRKLRGRVRSNAGRPWAATAVVGIPNVGMTAPEAIASYAALARIERQYHPIRDTAKALRASRAVNLAELTKGL